MRFLSKDSGNHHSGYLMLLQNISTALTLQMSMPAPFSPIPHTRQSPHTALAGAELSLGRVASPGGQDGARSPVRALLATTAQRPWTPRTGQGACPQGCRSARKFLTQAWTVPLKDLRTISITGFHLFRIFSCSFWSLWDFFFFFLCLWANIITTSVSLCSLKKNRMHIILSRRNNFCFWTSEKIQLRDYLAICN